MRAELTSATIEGRFAKASRRLLTGPGLGVKMNQEALKRYAAS